MPPSAGPQSAAAFGRTALPHSLCEQDADALAVTLDAVAEKVRRSAAQPCSGSTLAAGITSPAPAYDIATLEHCIARAQNAWGVTVYLEPVRPVR